jgi:hypothetical protein
LMAAFANAPKGQAPADILPLKKPKGHTETIHLTNAAEGN